jgi:hypothetical protein
VIARRKHSILPGLWRMVYMTPVSVLIEGVLLKSLLPSWNAVTHGSTVTRRSRVDIRIWPVRGLDTGKWRLLNLNVS